MTLPWKYFQSVVILYVIRSRKELVSEPISRGVTMRKISILWLLLTLLLASACDMCWIQNCDDDEQFECLPSDLQLTPVLEAYNTMEHRHLDCCLADDFVFYFNPADSARVGPTFPTMFLTREQGLTITENLFDNVESVGLSVTGTEVFDYSGDPERVMKRLPREIELTVVFEDSSGFIASGPCDFIVRPVGAEYEIVKIFDYSGTFQKEIIGGESWGYVLWYFR